MRLGRFTAEKAAAYSHAIYNHANQVHLKGTCWAMVMDWARRFVLKGKMGFAAKTGWDETRLLHRGKYIAHVMDLKQYENYESVGAKLLELEKAAFKKQGLSTEKTQTQKLLDKYNKEQIAKPGQKNRTVPQKFDELSFTFGNEVTQKKIGDLELYGMHIGNLDEYGEKNTRLLCIDTLTNKINTWKAEADRLKPLLFARGIGFYFVEKIGYQKWSVNAARQKESAGKKEKILIHDMLGKRTERGTKIVNQRGGHELGFAYDPESRKYCFMDPNLGEWISEDPRKVATIIYDVLKCYTVFQETGLNNPLWFCASINQTETSLFAKKKVSVP